MDTTRLGNLLADPQTISVLASADDQAQPNVAVFGSPQLLKDGRLMLALSDNRTWENLEKNRHAVLLTFKPAEQVFAWQGVRAYLELERAESEGPLFEQLLVDVERQAGRMAARMVRRAALFKVRELRPLLDTPKG